MRSQVGWPGRKCPEQRLGRRPAQQDHHQRLVMLHTIGDETAIGRVLPFVDPLDRAGERGILQPLHPAIHRRIPGGRKPLRPGLVTQLVERLHAFPGRAQAAHR